ncbi:MAG TPA: radical SAM protein [Polyangia bacterium]|jgi:MoaA/NifB/PqqE/SkfB family radical SAM enzyme
MLVSLIAHALAIRAGGRARPVHVNFEVTHRCNLACVYCDRHTPAGGEVTHQQAVALLAELADLGMTSVSLDGGEPLARPRIDEVVAWLVDRAIVVDMNSNGLLVPRHRATIRRLSHLTISMDGPAEVHDAARGAGAFDRAVRGLRTAQDLGVAVGLTCTVARHNAAVIDRVLDVAVALGCQVVFQPARSSLILGAAGGDARPFQLGPAEARAAFAGLEAAKAAGLPVGNRWSSLRHFRTFPDDTPLPCAAGWVNATLDPRGRLFPCGLVSRSGPAPSALHGGAAAAFRRLARTGCAQCWCARVVEGNYAWGARVDRMIPPLGAAGAGGA